MLVLRTVGKDLKSRNDFQWPEKGPVECPDWNEIAQCGNGLHGLPWGEGYCCAFCEYLVDDGKAQVVEVDDASIVRLEGGEKCKFPRGNVLLTGTLEEATQFILANGGMGRAVAHAKVTVGDRQSAVSGTRGTATAGTRGTATAGTRGTATAGDSGTATAGDSGTATAGYGGTATAGYGGTIQIAFYDWNKSRKRIVTGYIGEDGLLPNVKYRLENKIFVPVDPQPMVAKPGDEVHSVDSQPAVST